MRPLFTSATCERRNITADFTSCHDTRSSRGALGFPHLASLNRGSHPSIITISVSSSPAAQPQSFGSIAGSHASPTLRMVAIAALGDMRPGHLSVQRRAGGRNRRGYAQLSYTFQKRSRTDYVQPEDVERIKSEIANYRKFKELCERLVALSIEESKRKTEQRRKALAAVRSQS